MEITINTIELILLGIIIAQIIALITLMFNIKLLKNGLSTIQKKKTPQKKKQEKENLHRQERRDSPLKQDRTA